VTHGDDPVQPPLSKALDDLLKSLPDPLLVGNIALYSQEFLTLKLLAQILSYLRGGRGRTVEDSDVSSGLGDGTGEG
jgi:hypothetical protein